MVYQALLQELVEEMRQQEEILGLLLTGSVARGDALPGSDLDLRCILPPGHSRTFQSELRQGILVERGYVSFYPWFCRLVRPWFCRGVSLREKEVRRIFEFLAHH